MTLYDLKENGALAYFIFKHPKDLSYGVPDTETQKRLLLDAFAGEGWEVPRLLEAMKTTSDFISIPSAKSESTSGRTGEWLLLGMPPTALRFLRGTVPIWPWWEHISWQEN